MDKQRLDVFIDPELYERLHQRANEEGELLGVAWDRDAVVERAIRFYLDTTEVSHGPEGDVMVVERSSGGVVVSHREPKMSPFDIPDHPKNIYRG